MCICIRVVPSYACVCLCMHPPMSACMMHVWMYVCMCVWRSSGNGYSCIHVRIHGNRPRCCVGSASMYASMCVSAHDSMHVRRRTPTCAAQRSAALTLSSPPDRLMTLSDVAACSITPCRDRVAWWGRARRARAMNNYVYIYIYIYIHMIHMIHIHVCIHLSLYIYIYI